MIQFRGKETMSYNKDEPQIKDNPATISDWIKHLDTVEFTYHGRYVKCVIDWVDPIHCMGKLLTQYYGKNEDWDIGEHKQFNIKELKNVKKIYNN